MYMCTQCISHTHDGIKLAGFFYHTYSIHLIHTISVIGIFLHTCQISVCIVYKLYTVQKGGILSFLWFSIERLPEQMHFVQNTV